MDPQRPRTIVTVVPTHVLLHVLSFLDRPSLCTVRLVCKAFCEAASESIRTLHLPLHTARRRPPQGLQRFPKLEVVECTMDIPVYQNDVPAWLEEHVTTVTVRGDEDDLGHNVDQFSYAYQEEFELGILAAVRLSRLTSLRICFGNLHFHRDHVWPKAWDTTLARPTQLRHLAVTFWSPALLKLVAQLTHLSVLHLGKQVLSGALAPSPRPDLGQLSTLHHLQELGFVYHSEVQMFPHQWSGLQGLTWLMGRPLVRSGPSRAESLCPVLEAMPSLRSLELAPGDQLQLAELLRMSQLCALTLHVDDMSGPEPICLAGSAILNAATKCVHLPTCGRSTRARVSGLHTCGGGGHVSFTFCAV